MSVLFFLPALLLLIMYIHERAKNKAITNEILYIKAWIAAASYTKENRYVLIPTEHTEIKELTSEINRLLDLFYLQKVAYNRSKQAMVQVLTNISHDLRTPLTVLKGYSELLNKEASKRNVTGNILEMADKIDTKADELVSTINEYFTMSKITSGDMKIELQRVNVTELCHEIILDYYDILAEAAYTVEIEIGSSPEYACADADALKRILKNLIDNAIKHGGDGKYLALRLKKPADQVVIEVEDHGKGIAKKEQERIFYRNYTTAHNSSGSGLGLTIAKNLSLQMEADIHLVSEPGRRTIFSLVLKS